MDKNRTIYIGDKFRGTNGIFEIVDKLYENGRVYLKVYHLDSKKYIICEYNYFKHLELEEV